MEQVVLVYALVLLTGTFTSPTEAPRIFFPDQLKHAEHEACNTHLGTAGTCERSCGQSFGNSELSKCGIKDSNFLYCCDPLTKTSGELVDISPPFVTFQCGKNSKNEYLFSPYGFGDAEILRPEAIQPSRDVHQHSEELQRRPGIPADDFNDFINSDTTSPPGTHAAVGGIVAEKNSWPWMALLGTKGPGGDSFDNSWFCGGVLINEQWVLSALHCFLFRSAEVVRLGEHDYADEYEAHNKYQDFEVMDTVLYPKYKNKEGYHDIALLKLASRVIFKEHIQPVCLPWGRESNTDITNQLATLTGWGDTEFGGFPSTILQEVKVTVFAASQCDRSYSVVPSYDRIWPQGIGEETLCAGDRNGGRDACQGDSGGPLMSQDGNGVYVLAGIVSRGYGCGHKDYPGLYANIRHPPYLSWIKNIAFASP